MVLNSQATAICLGGGLLLSGLLSAPATAQTVTTDDNRWLPSPVIEAKPPLRKPNSFHPDIPEPVSPASAPTQLQAAPLRLVLKLNERRVYVYRGEVIETSYPVAVGKAGWETPTGEFEVFSTVAEPGWTNPFTNEVMPPGPDNPLGDRWIAFWTDGENLIGFHGTPNRESVGQAASHGCIRMYNEHIRELFEGVEVGTPVTVVL